ncbi:hypothetical protein EW146_g6301 [Bondarzewia mesenterica]|uniref:Secreted protein n=1 Tax=Bondarzewia mesenterica TaxID=1095465 RepID=A0A4S4LUP1_9AGAM|nr:hypothetical protein EW146_g6301 [Bondarzewia mesenterica]
MLAMITIVVTLCVALSDSVVARVFADALYGPTPKPTSYFPAVPRVENPKQKRTVRFASPIATVLSFDIPEAERPEITRRAASLTVPQVSKTPAEHVSRPKLDGLIMPSVASLKTKNGSYYPPSSPVWRRTGVLYRARFTSYFTRRAA